MTTPIVRLHSTTCLQHQSERHLCPACISSIYLSSGNGTTFLASLRSLACGLLIQDGLQATRRPQHPGIDFAASSVRKHLECALHCASLLPRHWRTPPGTEP